MESVTTAFDGELQAIEGAAMGPADLRRNYPGHPTVDPALTWTEDLGACAFYPEFAAKPNDRNLEYKAAQAAYAEAHGPEALEKILASRVHHPLKRQRRYDFRLEPHEERRLARWGFVVSSRLGQESFGEAYYRLYSDDLPVFITADSILHAWHRSFDAMLMEIEERHLEPRLRSLLDNVRVAIETALGTRESTTGSPIPRQVLIDLHTFVCVPLMLLSDPTPPIVGRQPDLLKSLNAVNDAQPRSITVLSGERLVDFSLFVPRGHYTKTAELSRYFKAMAWIGMMDMRFVRFPQSPAEERQSLHELQCAVALVHFLHTTAQLDTAGEMEKFISQLVGGGADSLTPSQLNAHLAAYDINEILSGDPTSSLSVLRRLLGDIVSSGLGEGQINAHLRVAEENEQSPVSFALCGQQFTLGAFVLSKVVDIAPTRRVPSAGLDSAFALMGNDAAVPVLISRMNRDTSKDASGHMRFRDGVPYASNLIALRRTVDAVFTRQEEVETRETKEKNPSVGHRLVGVFRSLTDGHGHHSTVVTAKSPSIGQRWIGVLRALSQPAASNAAVFRTDAWRRRMMTTQIGSYAQLRHDTLLYTKQSCSMMTLCEYPAGYVEPYPEFWSRFQRMVTALRDLLVQVELGWIQVCLERFLNVLGNLHRIAVLQSRREPLGADHEAFLKNVMEERQGSGGSRYLGWYPSLFYPAREDAGKRDVLVADVHTDPPSALHGDPGWIVHLGVGAVPMGFFLVDNVMYAGPVFSVFEVVTPFGERLTDEQFAGSLHRYAPEDWAENTYLC